MSDTSPHPRLIGLYSSVPQSGKTTLAEMLVQQCGYGRIGFADPLKGMLGTLLECAGEPRDVIIHMLHGSLKDTRIPRWDKSPRQLLQTLGTTWGRGMVHPTIWTGIAMDRAMRSRCAVIIDDVRFPNEYFAIKNMGGIMIKITRSSAPQTETHISEGALNDYPFDHTITNDGTVPELHAQCVSKLFRQQAEMG